MPPPARHAPRLMPHRVVVLAGGLVGLLLALALGALAWAEHEANDERVRAQTEVMARVFADHATRSIDATALALTTVDELLSRGVEPEAPELLGALKQTLVNLPFLRGVAVVDAQGLVLASADPADRGITLDWPRLGARPAAGRVAVGSFVAARRLGDLNPATAGRVPAGVGFLPVLLTTRLPNGRELTAVALVNLDAFSNFQQVTLDDERMASALLGYDGRLLAATQGVAADPGVALAGLAPFARFLPQREHASWSGPGLRSEGQIASFRVSRNWPLVVLVEFDEAAAHAQWWRDSRGRLAVGAGVLLATFVMTALAARSLRARAVAQARVVAREREMGVTLAGLQEVVFRCDSDGRLSFVNPAFERLTGCTAADCIGRSFFDAVAAEDRIAARRLLAPVPADGRARTASLALQAADGRGLQHDCVVTPLPRGAGFVGSAVDVTERLQARRTLQAQLAFSEMLLESSPLPMSVVGRDRRYRIVNRAWEAFSGRRREDALGGPVGAHLSPEERRVHEQQDERVYATGEPLRYEARVPHADGSLRDVLIEKRALPGAVDGESAGILAVIIDVTEFRAAERATREARDAAEDASRAKSEFIANISHELRTPLQSIIGFSELGLRRAGEQARLAAMFGDIHASGQRMLALVNDLLDVARIESSAGTLHLERADMRTPVREVLREMQPLAAKRGVVLAEALPEAPMLAKLDPLRFGQVVRNVVANAVRFSPEGGRIDLEADVTEAGEWRLRVADRGPGIPAGEHEAIFEAFVQSSRTKDGSGGTGLGLAISRTIMQAHGGRITAHDRPGGGSVFEIVLPARSGDTLPAPLA
jgi:PAS domain S-box-containing protein